jgi:hypothetical protein
MFRKMTIIAIPAMALALTLGTGNSASQAFAKGGVGKGGPKGMSKDHRGRDWKFRRFDRYGWGYGFGYVEPIVEAPVVAPPCTTCEVAPAAVPACPTCAPAVCVATPEYFPFWGYGKYGKFYGDRHHRERSHRGGHGGRR